MKNFELTLPASLEFNNEDIIVTDPCYFIPDIIWQELCKAWYTDEGDENEYTREGVIVFQNGAKVIYSGTAYGDGDYPVYVKKGHGNSVHADHTGVDAGMIAVISINDLNKIESYRDVKKEKSFSIDDEWYPRVNNFSGKVYADGEGNFIGDLEVNTQGSEESEEYEEYDEDE